MNHLQPSFLLSENLNRLARWLRLLGYDAALYRSIDFDNMIRIANRDRRIILTRDRKQATSRKKFNRRLIQTEYHLQQLRELQDLIRFDQEYAFTRCLECNRRLFAISAEKIKDLVPEYTRQQQQGFLYCRQCGRIYWQGDHYRDMKDQLDKIFSNEKMGEK
ncbi:MAG: hypothetical protein JW784_04085 [Candidatus Cloacimonetes bacterium]|nr:hypothetical protein [Candidatus Cloacimonadota bacterium]